MEVAGSRKKRATASLIACDHCRKLKVKCDGVLPCARCSKNSLLCIFSPGKKKHSILHLQKKIESSEGKQLEVSTNFSSKENVLMTSHVINHFVDYHVSKLSQFFNQPEARIKEIFPFDSLQGKLQLYSILSLHFRSKGELDVSDKFLNHSLSLSKEIFDDCQSDTTIHSAFGLSSLASALSTKDMKKAQHFINMSSSLLEDCEFSNQEYNYLKFFRLRLNSTFYPKNVPPNFALIQNFALGLIDHLDLIAVRSPKFKIEDYNHLDPRLIVKMGAIEAFAIIREVIFHFDPSMSEISWTINEEYLKANLRLPEEVAELCLQFIEKVERSIFQHFPNDPFLKNFDLNYFKGILYRWSGNHEKEIVSWKKTLQFLNEDNNNLFSTTPFIRLVVPIFYSAYYLLEWGINEDQAIDRAFSLLHRFGSPYPIATQVLNYLTKIRELSYLKVHELSESKLQQSCLQGRYSLPTSSSSSSSSPETYSSPLPNSSMMVDPFPSQTNFSPSNCQFTDFQVNSTTEIIETKLPPEGFETKNCDLFHGTPETFPSWYDGLEIERNYEFYTQELESLK